MIDSPRLPLEVWGRRLMARAEAWADRSRFRRYAYEFLWFGLKQGWACLFGGAMLALILGTFLFWPDQAPLARYDFLVLGALGIQAAMLALKLESWEEARVIFLFHVAGTIMELFKTYHGSWIYPEVGAEDRRRAAVLGLHVCGGGQLHRAGAAHLPYPGAELSAAVDDVGAGGGDLRQLLCAPLAAGHPAGAVRGDGAAVHAGVVLLHRRPDAAVDAAAAGLWAGGAVHLVRGEPGTFARAWVYPGQEAGWHMVSLNKLGAWFLLMIISVVLVSIVHRPEEEPRG